nr:site-specific DNA-methyltransferase [Candidatus Nitrosotenuis chungbukensis]
MTIIEKVLKHPRSEYVQRTLFPFFGSPENNPPLREAIEFYKHDQSWSNRLIAGDSRIVMNSLLEKEGMKEKIQMIYIDPPYGIKYGSNFQPFVNKKNVVDGKDEDLTQEPETIRAFRDTWELGIHSYLTYLRDRLLLARELLTESGSIFVQISDENVHHVRELMDEVFQANNFVSLIVIRTRSTSTSKFVSTLNDYIVWYAKNIEQLKYHQLYEEKEADYSRFCFAEIKEKIINVNTFDENERKKLNPFSSSSLNSTTGGTSSNIGFNYKGKTYFPAPGRSWRCSIEGLEKLAKNDRIFVQGNNIRYKYYYDDFPFTPLTNLWIEQISEQNKIFVVQTGTEAIRRCMLMTTDPSDLVFDPTCGSGTTAFTAEKWGRRWITCDSSRVAITLAKQRLMTSLFDYYEFAHPNEGSRSGFKYKTVPHITLKSIANNELPPQEILYDHPLIDKTKTRVTGPFTVEAVPSPIVKSFDSDPKLESEIDISLSRVGETLRQDEWRNELLKTGIRGKSGQKIEFSRAEILSGTQWLQVDAETKEKEPKRVVVSFGPEYAPLEQRQVSLAIDEAQKLVPKPKIIVFAAFQFDPEAAKDIDELNWPGVTILKVQMNADLLTGDLKKERSNNESFWLMGQPDVELKKDQDNKYVVEVNGFDYYNTKTGEIESGDSSRISMWMLDTDYDGRSLYPQQVFFPMSRATDVWGKLGKTLKTEINEELLEQYSGTISLPFIPGANKQMAVKIIDDRGIESLRILQVE